MPGGGLPGGEPGLPGAAPGAVEVLGGEGGLVLGAMPGMEFPEHQVQLLPGDRLVLYTDGVTEALDVNGLEFGISKLIEAVQASSPSGASAVLSRITSDLKSFASGHPQNDDITLIAIRKL